MKPYFFRSTSLRAPGTSQGPALSRTIGDMIGEPTAHWSEGEQFETDSDRAAALIAKAGLKLRTIK